MGRFGWLLLAASCASASHVAELEERIAALEARASANLPGWEGWVMSGSGAAMFSARLDQAERRGQKVPVLVSPAPEVAGEYGTWMTGIDARPYVGKRIRVTLWVKTAGNAERVDVWSRAQAPDSPGDGMGLGGQLELVEPETDWHAIELIYEVDPRAIRVQIGAGVAGQGRLWMDKPSVDVIE